MIRLRGQWIMLLAVSALFFWSGCVDQDFDEPPVRGLSTLEPNKTIADLLALGTGAGDVEINDEFNIGGVVVADDRSGNLYKQIVIQDNTGGILVRLNAVGLYNDFPEGSRLVIKCQGLSLGYYEGLPQLNGSPGQAVEEVRINQHVFVTERDVTVEPRIVTIPELADDAFLKTILNTLVKFESVQFASADAGATYADAVNQFSLNRNVEDCNKNAVILRSSGFADFAAQLTPTGSGTLTAVMSVFRGTRQLVIRDPDDVQMTGDRCDPVSGGTLMPISDLRTVYTTGGVKGPDGKNIKGVVISDRTNNNWDGRNLVIQDGTAGIMVRFTSTHTFNLGDEVEVGIGGQELSEFRGLLQVNNVSNDNAVKKGAGQLPTPRATTVQEYKANAEAWESTLVKFTEVELTGNAVYSGTVTITDGANTLPMFTRSQANFSGSAVPTGKVNVTGVASDFDGAQLIIRNLSDVEGGNTGSGGTPISLGELRQLFAGGASTVPTGKTIKGIVISDYANANTTTKNLVFQDTSGGVVIRLTADHTYPLGTELEIQVGGQELSEFNGLLQINNVPNALVTDKGAGTLPTPKTVTIQEILTDMQGAQKLESTLVKIANATFPEGGSYSGSKNVTDGTGTIVMFTRTQAPFANSNVPAGAVTIVAMVSDFNAPQINIRSLADIQ